MIVGFTGHQNISHPGRWGWVQEQFTCTLREVAQPGTQVLTSLAKGGDQIISQTALSEGAAIAVIVPCRGYEQTFHDPADLAQYEKLLGEAADVVTLDFAAPSEDAFLAAGKLVADRSLVLITLWNGKKAAGKGGTGDIVAYAQSLGRRVIHINPDAMQVTRLGPWEGK